MFIYLGALLRKKKQNYNYKATEVKAFIEWVHTNEGLLQKHPLLPVNMSLEPDYTQKEIGCLPDVGEGWNALHFPFWLKRKLQAPVSA